MGQKEVSEAMGWTKLQFITKAYEKIGFASYIYDIQPEQLDSAMLDLNSMMAAWDALGIRIGYPLPSDAQSGSINDPTGVPDSASLAIYLNLGIILAPGVGKTVSIEHKTIAKNAYDALVSYAASQNVQSVQMPKSMPRGAGQKPWRVNQPFVTPPVEPLTASGGSDEISF